MKIAINCAFYQPKGGGIKEYIHNLTNSLSKIDKQNEYVLYVLKDQVEFAKKNLPSDFRIKVIPFNSKSTLDSVIRSLFEQSFWLKEEKKEKFDIFHSPFFHSPHLKKAKTLLTVHDLRLYRYPSTYAFLRYNFLKKKVRKSIRKAHHIISISNFTRDEIKNLCGVGHEKVTVIHEAICRNKFSLTSDFIPEKVPIEIKRKPFLLTVGHMEPRKNYDRLIEAFLQMKEKEEFQDFQLVIVGKKDHSYESTLKMIESRKDIFYLNFIDHDTLLWLYKKASLFVFPSFYEGFGFPPLEAASLNTISAVSNVSSVPEICGDAAIYFNPFNTEDIRTTIEKALTDKDLRKEKESLLESQISKFSWEKNARETMMVYDKLQSEAKNPSEK